MSNELELDRVAIKKQAKKLLDGKTWSLIGWFAMYGLVLLLCTAVSWFMPMPLQTWLNIWIADRLFSLDYYYNYYIYDIIQIVVWAVFVFIKCLLFSALSFPFSVCMSSIPLAIVEGQDVTWQTVLSPISRARYFIEYSITGAMTYTFTFLWSLLLFVPGIAASYRYSFAKYLYVRNSEQTAGEVVTMSKKMTLGFKMSMFTIDLSFIGWFLVGIVTCGIGLVYMICYSSVTHAIVFKMLEDNLKNIGTDDRQNTETKNEADAESEIKVETETDIESTADGELEEKDDTQTKAESNENTEPNIDTEIKL